MCVYFGTRLIWVCNVLMWSGNFANFIVSKYSVFCLIYAFLWWHGRNQLYNEIWILWLIVINWLDLLKTTKWMSPFSFSFLLTCRSYIKSSTVHLKFGLTSERRQAEASRIREKHPDRVPVRISSGYEDSLYSSNSGNTFPSNQACGALCRWLWKRLEGVMSLTLIRRS
jgi:hypothetical protein